MQDCKKKKLTGYSPELFSKFQKTYFEKFGEEISLEKANMELNYLAQTVEILFAKIITRKERF